MSKEIEIGNLQKKKCLVKIKTNYFPPIRSALLTEVLREPPLAAFPPNLKAADLVISSPTSRNPPEKVVRRRKEAWPAALGAEDHQGPGRRRSRCGGPSRCAFLWIEMDLVL